MVLEKGMKKGKICVWKNVTQKTISSFNNLKFQVLLILISIVEHVLSP
jgi:hypothetical protein